jgi:alpha-D-xyloside xylohydrolase
MRLHGSRLRTKSQKPSPPDVIEPTGGDNEIWCFGEENYPVLKKLIELRERMKPYTQKYMDIASRTGKPIMRPMFFDYYLDEICYTLEEQYMYGEDILVAPIVGQGQVERLVYLPEGNWVNVFDRKTSQGKQFINCHADIHEFIAFVKEGSDALAIFDIL